jgi:predicted secreted hydrolase
MFIGLQMFMAAAFSFVLYTLIFLRMRGNIVLVGRRISFRRTGTAWRGKQFENQALAIARLMLLCVNYYYYHPTIRLTFA